MCILGKLIGHTVLKYFENEVIMKTFKPQTLHNMVYKSLLIPTEEVLLIVGL